MSKRELAEKFNALFAGLTIAHGKMQLKETFKGSGKREAYHAHVKEIVTVEAWEGHLDGKSIGIVPIRDDGSSCVFGAIDIDAYDNFSFDNLLTKITSLNLPLVVCRSKSGGAHCYLFMREPVPAELIHSKLREWASAIGYASNTRGEPTEVFPKQVKLLIESGDVGSFINMPYAGGEKTQRYAMVKIGDQIKHLTAEEFLDLANEKKMTPELIKNIYIPKCPEFSDGPPCLQILAKLGVHEGGRNIALFGMGAYARMAFPDGWEEKIEEYNHKYLVSPLSSKEVTTIIKSVSRKDYHFPCKQHPLVDHCHRSECIQKKFGVGSDLGETPVLDTIQKINTDPPTYILGMLDRTGKPIPVMLNSEELLSTRKIKKKCLETMNYLPFIPKQNEWEKLLQQVMERVVVIEVPEDSSASGQMFHHLESFLNRKAKSNNRKELLSGRPIVEEEKLFFRMVDFCVYLEQNHFRNFKPHEIAAIFRYKEEKGEMGHRAFNIEGKCVQTWYIYKTAGDLELDVPDEVLKGNVY